MTNPSDLKGKLLVRAKNIEAALSLHTQKIAVLESQLNTARRGQREAEGGLKAMQEALLDVEELIQATAKAGRAAQAAMRATEAAGAGKAPGNGVAGAMPAADGPSAEGPKTA